MPPPAAAAAAASGPVTAPHAAVAFASCPALAQLKECLELVDSSRDMWYTTVKAIDKKSGKIAHERTPSQQRVKAALSSRSKASDNMGGSQNQAPNTSPGDGGKSHSLSS